MLGPGTQEFVEAELAYRRERIMADLQRTRDPRDPRRRWWPVGLLGPRRYRRGTAPRPMPSPHHATSH
jgi:hypothetical protein